MRTSPVDVHYGAPRWNPNVGLRLWSLAGGSIEKVDEAKLAERAIIEADDEGGLGELTPSDARFVRFGIWLDHRECRDPRPLGLRAAASAVGGSQQHATHRPCPGWCRSRRGELTYVKWRFGRPLELRHLRTLASKEDHLPMGRAEEPVVLVGMRRPPTVGIGRGDLRRRRRPLE